MTTILSHFPPGRSPRPIQTQVLTALEKLWDTADVFVISLPVGCHAPGQGILMYDGTVRKVEDIRIGDLLMGPDSLPRTVTFLHQGKEEMYKITPNRGESWIVNKSHILALRLYNRRKKNKKVTYTIESVNISVNDYLNSSNNFKHNTRMYRTTALDFPKAALLPIPPYIFGLWLGDGNSSGAVLTTQDAIIEETWIDYARATGNYVTYSNNGSAASTIRITSGYGPKNNINDLLKSINVINNKHIPLIYKTASISHRLELLAGLIDTDGSIGKNKSSVEITQKSEQLIDDIIYIARSLGISAYKHKKIINKRSYWRCGLTGKLLKSLPVKLQYKYPGQIATKDYSNYQFSVNPLGEGQYYGFEVDKDNLYTLADFTVTHNSGKSNIAVTVGEWAKGRGTHIVTPTNQLVDQYLNDFKHLTVLRSKSSRTCNTWGKPLTQVRGLCSPHLRCDGCERYKKDKACALLSQLLVNNVHTYVINRLYRSVLIVDEAHLLLPILRDFSAVNVWEASKVPFPNFQSEEELVKWSQEVHPPGPTFKKLFQELKNHVPGGRPKYHLELGWEANRGKMRKRMKMTPISLEGTPPRMWPAGVGKIILMSATINKKDVQALGLTGKRVVFMDGESPILAAQRPVIFDPELSVSMAQSQLASSMPAFIDILARVAGRNPDAKGVVHLTYSLAKTLREMASIPADLRGRLLFHTKETKNKQYQLFRESLEPKILVASGMYEGIDLPYDLARWQVVGKIPWGNLGDPMTKHQQETDPSGYAWEAMKKLIQATGRTTRAEDDFSRVWITDSTFLQLWQGHHLMFPRWFRDSVQMVEGGE